MKQPILTIVVPCFNEEEILPYTFIQLKAILNEMITGKLIDQRSSLLFVDDGSKDRTWELIEKEGRKNERIRGIKLSSNVGHQNALLAGITKAKNHCDCMITIDADLQDDIQVMKDFIQKYKEGYDVVYGVRKKRETDSFFKKSTAQLFYKLMKWMNVDIIYNHADFRLLSKRAADALTQYTERNFFIRGIIPLIGFPSTIIYYDRKERIAGETKYPFKKMVSFALEGITSFTVTPIRFILYVGIISFIITMFISFYTFYLMKMGKTDLPFATVLLPILIFCEIQLIAIGIIGEYIGKIYKEVKRRPRYFIEKDTIDELGRDNYHDYISENDQLLESN